MGSRVELFAAIRWDYQREGLGVRALARKYDVHRRTVRQAMAGWIDEMLREDLAAPRKQRHTARRVFERLRDEHDAQVSYSTVARYVQRRGAGAGVDFGDVLVELAGHLARCYLFACRLSFAGKACHRVYACQAQEAFLDGHVTAFEATGGVPWRHVRYDNLSPAVAKVLAGRSRTETARWLSFRSWYKSVPASSRSRLVPKLLLAAG